MVVPVAEVVLVDVTSVVAVVGFVLVDVELVVVTTTAVVEPTKH